MLLIDGVLAAPFKGLMWVFEEIAQAVRESKAAEAEALKEQLAELYRQLESGAIDETEFDALEANLLDRLDALTDEEEP